jgi:hypothetical protein
MGEHSLRDLPERQAPVANDHQWEVEAVTILSLKEFKTGLEYHDTLNPALWNHDQLKPEVLLKLTLIADNFMQFVGLDPKLVHDIVLTGSSANYNYSAQSDIDLHIIAQYQPDHRNSAGISIQDAFDAFKTLYNEERHITIYGYPLELYVQPTSEHFTSNAGVFSLKRHVWIQRPVKQHVDLDDREIQVKARAVMHDINQVVHGKMASVLAKPRIQAIKAKIKQLRAAGLHAGGEFGIENLAFKAIRNSGYLDKLSKYSEAIKDNDLSLR